MRKQPTSRIDGLYAGLALGIVMCIVFAVDGREPTYWYIALALALVALGAFIAERILR
jgi:hypothetical protein